MAQPDNITKLKQPSLSIRTDKDAKAIKPRQTKFSAKVEGITGLRLITKPDGKKNWEAVFKVNGKTKTFSYGIFPSINTNEAIRRATDDYAQIKQGNDPTRQKRLAKQTALSTSRAETPIIELAEQRTAHLLSANKLSEQSAELDRLYIRKLGKLLGRKAFADFTQKDATTYYKATKASASDCEKLHKLIKKTYNFLDNKTKEQVPLDVARELEVSWPLPAIKKNTDRFIHQDEMGLMWSRLMHSQEASVHKDAVLMALLTGERKSAVLNIKKSDVKFNAVPIPYLYMEGKLSNGTPTKNAVPITPVLGAFIERLMTTSDSDYLFPAQRKGISKHLTDISKQLFKDLGILSGYTHSTHSFRRTAANLAGNCIGSYSIADEHILHFTKHTSGAKANYLDSTSQGFLAARYPTFQKYHKYLDDIITAQGIQEGMQPLDQSLWATTEPIAFIAQGITFPAELDPMTDRPEPNPSPTVSIITANKTGIFATSPLYSYLTGQTVEVPILKTERPQTYQAIKVEGGMLTGNDPRLKAQLLGTEKETEIPDFKSKID